MLTNRANGKIYLTKLEEKFIFKELLWWCIYMNFGGPKDPLY